MQPVRYDLIDTPEALRGIRAGETWQFGCTIKIGGGPENLTGKSFAFAIRRLREEATVYVSATSANGRIVLGGAAGTVQVTLGPDMTRRLMPGRYWYAIAETVPMSRTRIEGLIDIVWAIVR